MNPDVTLSIILDQRRPKKDKTFPVKLRITHQRKQKYYATGFSLSPGDFKKARSENPPAGLTELHYFLQDFRKKAYNIANELEEFTFERFERSFLEGKKSNNQLWVLYEDYIAKLIAEERLNTLNTYRYSMSSLQSFKENLSFDKITPKFLQEYERWMLAQGKSITSVGIYLRSLKTIINLAISQGYMRQQQYPFGTNKYQIPAGRNIKKALKKEEVKRIFEYSPASGTLEEYSRDLWVFSYLCNGVNIKDIARLKYKNLDEDKIIFIRAKTEHSTRQKLKPIIAYLIPRAKEIINRWGNKEINKETYIFPILDEHTTPQEEVARVKQTVKNMNKYMRRIGEKLGIEKDITTYTARHTFSTVLKRSGAPVEFISESLGHSSIKTTDSYLDSFEDDTRKEFSKFLTDF